MPKMPKEPKKIRPFFDIEFENNICGGVARLDNQLNNDLKYNEKGKATGRIIPNYYIGWYIDEEFDGLVKILMHVAGQSDLFVRFNHEQLCHFIDNLNTCKNSLEGLMKEHEEKKGST